jgi:putative YhdH/YhfP family quinone oxidoreductase
MAPETFKALLVEQTSAGFTRRIANLSQDDLPAGDVLIRVHYSSLNYKDALSATGHPGVSKKFPHVPGVDAAGEVISSDVFSFQPGNSVIVLGFDLGMNTWGGFAEYIRVPAAWVMPLPQGMTRRESMMFGTAGFTAALSVDALVRQGVEPGSGEVLVTGATGGVGSLAVAILAKLGYSVVAVTGKPDQHDYLRSLGAATIVPRDEVDDRSDKPLLKGRWAGVVDTVGGNTLASVLKATRYGGCVTACGLVGGNDLITTVYPFILRGVSLVGIDSVNCPMSTRVRLWEKLAGEWKPPQLDAIASVISLEQVSAAIDRILAGQVTGRIVVAQQPNSGQHQSF